MNLCLCGCGQLVVNKYKRGHNPIVRRPLGYQVDEKELLRRQKISLGKKGKRRPDMVGENNPAKRPEIGLKISQKAKGRKISWANKISLTLVNKHLHGLTGNKNPMFGKTGKNNPFHSSNLSPKQQEHHRLINTGILNPNWKGGAHCGQYAFEFNSELKLAIRIREGYKCFICKKEEIITSGLRIHHIDYDKKNSNLQNLVALCNNCHVKTNGHRQYWIDYFSRQFNVSRTLFSYDEIQIDCKELATKLQNTEIEGIVPIPRGGAIPAVILSYLLSKPIKIEVTSEKDLIIDEIVDFGVTFRRMRKRYPKNLFACLHLNENHYKADKLPDFYVRKVNNWIVYPWETKP